jgi:hypothetical protein
LVANPAYLDKKVVHLFHREQEIENFDRFADQQDPAAIKVWEVLKVPLPWKSLTVDQCMGCRVAAHP